MSRRTSSGNIDRSTNTTKSSSRNQPTQEEIVLTGQPFIDHKILNYLDDAELHHLFDTDKTAAKYKTDENFWRDRIDHYYPGASKFKNKSTSNSNYYHRLSKYEMSNEGATKAAHNSDYSVLNYMYSIGYIPKVAPQIYNKGNIKIFIWLKEHNIDFREESLIDSMEYIEYIENVKDIDEVIMYLYENKYPFSEEILRPIICNGRFEIADMLIEKLDLMVPRDILYSAIVKENPELLDEIIRRYDLYPDDIVRFKDEGINLGWGEFFDYTITMTPPIYPNDDDLNNAIENISLLYNYFVMTKSILRISEEHELNLEYNPEVIDFVFSLRYDQNYGIKYDNERDNFSYPGDQQLEIWEWFLSRKMLPTYDYIHECYLAENCFHFIRLLILYRRNIFHILFGKFVSEDFSQELYILDLLTDMIGYSLENNIYPSYEDLYLTLENVYNHKIILENYLNELFIREYNFGEACSVESSIINDIIELGMHEIAKKIMRKYNVKPDSSIFNIFSLYDIKMKMALYHLRPGEKFLTACREGGKIDIIKYIEENP